MDAIAITEKWKWAIPRLISYYQKEAKEMPWRSAPSPYSTWISEIMLQQTRTAAAIPHFLRFIKELPDVAALAAVSDDKLMKLWEGLGYYSRARNLKKAACQILEAHGGEIPRDFDALKLLPGIGDYTAGAIASIAFGLPEPAVDGNVLRVAMRFFGWDDDIMLSATKKRVSDSLRRGYPTGEEASLLTQGIMELGETICIPNGAPRCEACPLAAECVARACGLTDRLPVKSTKKARRKEERTVFLLRHDEAYGILRRPTEGLLAGLWEFPSCEGRLSHKEAKAVSEERFGVSALSVAAWGEATHIFSHVEWHMTGYLLECSEKPPALTWATADELKERYALPSAFRFYLDRIRK